LQVHAELAELPEGEDEPNGQFVQDDAPEFEYESARHEEQLDAPVCALYLPASHTKQSVSAPPLVVPRYFPAAQSVQVAAAAADHLPTAHAVQYDAPLAPIQFKDVPATQF
jgi:hypothetical protein